MFTPHMHAEAVPTSTVNVLSSLWRHQKTATNPPRDETKPIADQAITCRYTTGSSTMLPLCRTVSNVVPHIRAPALTRVNPRYLRGSEPTESRPAKAIAQSTMSTINFIIVLEKPMDLSSVRRVVLCVSTKCAEPKRETNKPIFNRRQVNNLPYNPRTFRTLAYRFESLSADAGSLRANRVISSSRGASKGSNPSRCCCVSADLSR
jgi:hypothetical protein